MRISDWSSDVCSSDLQYTRANRTQEGAGGHSRYLVRARRKANIKLLVRNQLPDGGRTMRVEMDRNARMSFLERADHMRQETERECAQRGDMKVAGGKIANIVGRFLERINADEAAPALVVKIFGLGRY